MICMAAGGMKKELLKTSGHNVQRWKKFIYNMYDITMGRKQHFSELAGIENG